MSNRLCCLWILVLGLSAVEARAQGVSVDIKWSPSPRAIVSQIGSKRVATGFLKPLFCVSPPGDTTRLFVVEQGGLIRILKLADGTKSTFLDISALIATGGEQGLLGLAFHPQYATNRKFYVNYTGQAAGETRVVEYQTMAADPDLADTSIAKPILSFSQPQSNHNGGWLGFDAAGLLYIATGDGGGANDNGSGHTAKTGNAQDLTDNLLGKLLRIDPIGDDFLADANRNYKIPIGNPFIGKTGDDEIWSYGLRNPWRCSFDRQTKDLYIGDVGQGSREEIDFQPANAAGGRNYGWRLREGKIATPGRGIGGRAPGAINPIYDYSHGGGAFQGNSVTGGYVYRGPITSIRGRYFFADFANSKVWSFEVNGSTIKDLTDWTAALTPDAGRIDSVSSFGEDDAGNLYIVDYDGELFRLEEQTTVTSLAPIVPAFVRGILSTRPAD